MEQAPVAAAWHSYGKNCIQPLAFLLNCPSKIDHYYNEIPLPASRGPGMHLVSAKSVFVLTAVLTGAVLIRGNLARGCLKRASTGLFIFHLIGSILACRPACSNSNDDENWKRWGGPKKTFEENHHFSEGDMSAKPWVLGGSTPCCLLRHRESSQKVCPGCWQSLDPLGVPGI